MAGFKLLPAIILATLVYLPSASGLPIKDAVGTLFRRGLDSPSPSELLHNTIAFGIPATLCFLLRLVKCLWVMKEMHLEDWLMCVTFFFYCSLLIFINFSAQYATNLFPPETLVAILVNPEEVANRILGSKLVIPLEQSMLLATWGVKVCIWLFLCRCCRQLYKYQSWLKALFAYIICGLLLIEILYFGVLCRPFYQYWALPVENAQCATYAHYSIVQMVFNISSDLGLIIIPFIMVSEVNLPLKRKLVLFFVFSLAIFTIVAAVLNKYYNFTSPLTTVYQLWYIREASVAMCVGNLINTWQLIQRIFRVRSFDDRQAGIQPSPQMAVSPGIPIRPRGGPFGDGGDSVRSGGGTPRQPGFKENFFSRMIMAGGPFSAAERALRGRRGVGTYSGPGTVRQTTTDESGMTGFTCVDADKGGGLGLQGTGNDLSSAVDPLMTLARDGDDATDAINYRNTNSIV